MSKAVRQARLSNIYRKYDKVKNIENATCAEIDREEAKKNASKHSSRTVGR